MTLTKVSRITRISVVVFAVVVVFYYLFVFVLLPVGKRVIIALFPEPNPPTASFGKLDPLEFEAKSVLGQGQSYVLNTKTGRLPTDFPDRMTVYKIKPPAFSYKAGQNASDEARVLGLGDEHLTSDVKGSVFRWLNSENGVNLTINIASRELFLTTPLDDLERLNLEFQPGSVTPQAAINTVKSVLTRINRFNDSLYTTGTQNTYLGKIRGNRILESTTQLDAQIVRVDVFRSVEGKYTVYGPDYKKGLINALVVNPARSSNFPQIPKLEAYYWEVETKSDATYAIIPVEEAWSQVSKNKGTIADVSARSWNPFQEYIAQRVDKILINNVKLAYYETPKRQNHLQPIYVFEGNYTSSSGGSGSIAIYYPAINPAYIKVTQTTN